MLDLTFLTFNPTTFNLMPLGIAFVAALCSVVMLAVYRRYVAQHQEDDFLHVHDGDGGLVAKQRTVAHRLQVLDAWGKSMTVLAVVLGLAFALIHAYRTWITT
jgi:hypothetical protein